MEKIFKFLVFGLLAMLLFVNNTYADELIYGEEIPVGSESDYQYVEDELIEDAYTDLTEEEATSLKITLEADGYTTVTVKSELVKTGEITATITSHFDTYEDALTYVHGLENSGITVSNVEFVYDTEDGTIDETYDTLDEAEAAITEFQSEYTTEEDPDVEKIHNEDEDAVEEFDETFDTQDEADEYLDSQMALASDDVVVTGEVTETTVAGDTINIRETFNSQFAANQRRNQLNNQYDVVENANVSTAAAGTIITDQAVVASTQYNVTNTSFFIIRRGNTTYVWTVNQLNQQQRAAFTNSYAGSLVINPPFANLNNVQFVSGYYHNLVTNNPQRVLTLSFGPNGMRATVGSNYVDNVVYGTFTANAVYLLTAQVHNNVTAYKAAGEVVTKGYDYKVTGSGTKTLESGTLTADTTVDVMEEVYSLDLTKQKYEYVGGDTDNPNTGDNSVYALAFGIVSLFGLATSISLRKVID